MSSTRLPATCQSEINPIRTLLFKHARDAFVGPRSINRQWQALNYTGPPDFEQAVRESDLFCNLVERLGVEVVQLPRDPSVGLDSIYPRDAAVICSRGVILCRMGKPARSEEPEAIQKVVEGLGLTVAGAIEGEGRLEGGDVVWLDSRTVAVGRGYRTNARWREIWSGNRVRSTPLRVSYLTYTWDQTRLGQGAGGDLDRVEQGDQSIVRSVQRGIQSRLYDRGRYYPTREQGVHHFHRLLAEFLGEETEPRPRWRHAT